MCQVGLDRVSVRLGWVGYNKKVRKGILTHSHQRYSKWHKPLKTSLELSQSSQSFPLSSRWPATCHGACTVWGAEVELAVGDIVRITGNFQVRNAPEVAWPEVYGQIGVVIALAKRLYIPAAKVMVLGEIAEFDEDELEKVCK